MKKNKKNKLLSKKITIDSGRPGQSINCSVMEACTNAEQLYNAGNILTAELFLTSVIKAVPGYSDPYLALAKILHAASRPQQAKDLVDKALSLDGKNANTLARSASILLSMHENRSAIELIKKAINLHPNNPQLHNQMGTILMIQGQLDQAFEHFKTTLRLDQSYSGAYWNIAISKPEALNDRILANMLTLADSPETTGQPKAALLFAIAKAYQQQKNIDKELFYLAKANQLIKATQDWDWNLEAKTGGDIRESIKQPLTRQSPDFPASDQTPIILATMPRSGATLIEQIISSHSKVDAGGESSIFHSAIINSAQELWNDNRYWKNINKEEARSFAATSQSRAKLQIQSQELSSPFITDKSTSNYFSLGAILTAFPTAKVIHCTRHPLSICLSCYQYFFPDGHEYTYDLADTAHSIVIFDHMMAHWKSVFPDQILTVSYEDLALNQLSESKRIFKFLDIEWEENCINFHKNTQIVHTASFNQVRQPMYTSAVHRWKDYEQYLGPANQVLTDSSLP